MKSPKKEGEKPKKEGEKTKKEGEGPSVKREEFNGLARQNKTCRKTIQRITENKSGHIIG